MGWKKNGKLFSYIFIRRVYIECETWINSNLSNNFFFILHIRARAVIESFCKLQIAIIISFRRQIVWRATKNMMFCGGDGVLDKFHVEKWKKKKEEKRFAMNVAEQWNVHVTIIEWLRKKKKLSLQCASTLLLDRISISSVSTVVKEKHSLNHR